MGEMRRVKVAAAGDPVVKDCRYAVAVSPAGIVYYSNLTEIRRLEPPKPTETQAAP